VRLLYAYAFSKKLPWLAQASVIFFENATACSKRPVENDRLNAA